MLAFHLCFPIQIRGKLTWIALSINNHYARHSCLRKLEKIIHAYYILNISTPWKTFSFRMVTLNWPVVLSNIDAWKVMSLIRGFHKLLNITRNSIHNSKSPVASISMNNNKMTRLANRYKSFTKTEDASYCFGVV